MLKNISDGIKNRYQMLAKRRPKSECNTTSAAMACIYTGHEIPSEGIMPEDYLMDILDSEEGRAFLQKIAPGAKYNPWNDSYCIAWAVNKALQKEVCRVVKVTMDQMITHISNGGAAVVGGGFLSGGTSGHFVCVVGFETDENNSVKTIIVDDPYGNYNTNYKDHFDGNDIKFTLKTFIQLTFGNSKTKTMQFYSKI